MLIFIITKERKYFDLSNILTLSIEFIVFLFSRLITFYQNNNRIRLKKKKTKLIKKI